jgi:single-strand DNA-binding protein
MSKGFIKVRILGNVGQDPETRQMPNGKSVTNISVAATTEWKDKATGEKREHTEWVRVAFFDALADIAGRYIKKGTQVHIEGRMTTRSFEKDGQKHYLTSVKADDLVMVGGRPEQDSQDPQSNGSQQEHYGAQPQNNGPQDDFNDDIPF